jgi:hypothetical protein
VLGHLEPRAHRRELLVAQLGFSPKPRDQRLLDVPLCGLTGHHTGVASIDSIPRRSHRFAPGSRCPCAALCEGCRTRRRASSEVRAVDPLRLRAKHERPAQRLALANDVDEVDADDEMM